MKHNSDYIQQFMQYYDYPEEAQRVFTEVEQRLDDEKDFGEVFDAYLTEYMGNPDSDLGSYIQKIEALANEKGVNIYTLDFVFVMNCTEILKQHYAEKGLPEQLFWDSASDLKYKLMECIECEGVWGTFVAGWNDGMLKTERFTYGRFQYEIRTYDWEKDFVTACGKVMHVGDTYINFHIPSSGVPLTDEVRLASYKEAYRHYKHLFPDGKMIFGCGSWLLYPRHREFLPERLNIRRFMDDFEVVGWSEKDHFGNDWRVFGHYSDLPCTEWPRDTALRKAYAEWICAGNKAGDAFGVFVFDGEKILTKEDLKVKTILFQGDSITDAGRSRDNDAWRGIGYPNTVAGNIGLKYPGQYNLINRGVSGDRVVDIYARIKKDITELEPDYLTVLIGVNDVWHELFEVPNGVDNDKYFKVYCDVIEEVLKKCPQCKIFILEPFVLKACATEDKWDIFRREVELRAASAKKVADKYSLTFIPLLKEFDALTEKAPACYWLSDGVHPTAAGHAFIAQKVTEALEKSF